MHSRETIVKTFAAVGYQRKTRDEIGCYNERHVIRKEKAANAGLCLRIEGSASEIEEKIALDIFLGPSYSSGDVKVTSGTDSFNTNAFSGFGLRTVVCFGFAF